MATLSTIPSVPTGRTPVRLASHLFAGAIALLFLLIMVALRTRPDAVHGGAYLRAFVARSADFAFFGAALSAFAALTFKCRVTKAATIGALAAVFVQILLTLWLAWQYDGLLIQRASDVRQQLGVITVDRPDGPISVKALAGANYSLNDPVGEITKTEESLLLAAEDERFLDRITNVDPIALIRAAFASFEHYALHRKQRQGASGVSEQVSGFLVGIRPGLSAGMWREKVVKMLVAFRVDDRFSREQIERLYLSMCPFGTAGGHEVIGIASAAGVFYGVDHTQLTIAQAAELMARLKAPSVLFPYKRDGEDEPRFEQRLNRLRERMEAVLNVAEHRGWITGAQRREAADQFLSALATPSQAAARAHVEHATSLFEAVRKVVPEAHARHLEVAVHEDAALEAVLMKAVRDGIAEFTPRLPVRQHHDDHVDVDAVLIDGSGAILAQTGLVNEPDDMASQIKPEHYALALQEGILTSMHERIPGRHDLAEDGLAHSINEDAYAVARAIGLPKVVEHLRTQGYHVVGPYLPVVIGAGVTGSPMLVAGNFLKFSYDRPGYRVEASPIASITDANTGAVLYEPARARVFRPEVAEQVRSAMEKVSSHGTAARQLSRLTEEHPIAAKTGTAGFFRRGYWQGRGGSWCIAIDSATGYITTVRVRWRSGRPLELEGGSSAALIVREVIAGSRVLEKGGSR